MDNPYHWLPPWGEAAKHYSMESEMQILQFAEAIGNKFGQPENHIREAIDSLLCVTVFAKNQLE